MLVTSKLFLGMKTTFGLSDKCGIHMFYVLTSLNPVKFNPTMVQNMCLSQ